MKRIILNSLFAMALIATISIGGCKKKTDATPSDTTKPTITLTGANPFTLTLNGWFTDPGFSATDNVDGNITNKVTTTASAINSNLVGTYTVNYSVTDAAGNVGTASRIVNVVNSAAAFAGVYSVRDSSYTTHTVATYNATMNASTTVNQNLNINNFWNAGTMINVLATYQGGTNFQMLDGLSSSLYPHCYVTSTASPINIIIDYYVNDGTADRHYLATYTKP